MLEIMKLSKKYSNLTKLLNKIVHYYYIISYKSEIFILIFKQYNKASLR